MIKKIVTIFLLSMTLILTACTTTDTQSSDKSTNDATIQLSLYTSPTEYPEDGALLENNTLEIKDNEQNYFILLSEIPSDYKDNWVSIYVDEELLIGPSRFNENRVSYDLRDGATQNSTLLSEGKHKLTLRIHAENERQDVLDLENSIAYKEIDYTVEK